MDGLILLGRQLAPFAIDCTVTISLAAIAGLLAARILGNRQPSRGFGFIAAAFGLAALLVLGRLQGQVSVDLPDPPAVPELRGRTAPAPEPAPAPLPAPTATPGLSGRYGSMFQILIRRDPPAAAPAPPSADRSRWLAGFGLAWLGGVLILGVRRLAGILAARRLLARSRPCRDPRLLLAAESVRILLDGRRFELRLLPGGRSALVAGLWRSRIILPAGAVHWTRERLASTLLHEHGHAQRLDVPVAEGMRLLAILAWVAPFPRRALGLALRLREQACDQAVVRAGIPRTAYATDLLDAAWSLAPGAEPAAAALAARPSTLEVRIRAVLDGPGVRPWWDRLLRTAAAASLVAAAGWAAKVIVPAIGADRLSVGETVPRGPGEWIAGADPGPAGAAARGAFTLAEEDGYARIRLRYHGRADEVRLAAVALPHRLPLGGRARLMVPFGDLVDGQSRRPFFNPGWSLWQERQAPALAAASGRVVVDRVEAGSGPVIELAHGDGLRTRYGLGREGRSLVQPGEFIAAGTPVGIPGAPSPFDLPILNFSVLVQVGEDRVALDPAAFLFTAPEPRRTPFAAGLLNAAVRLEDQAQLARLLACGLTPDHPASDGTLPLEWALLAGNLPIAGELLAAGADPQAPTWDVHQAHIAWHGPTLAELARDTGDPALVCLFVPSPPAVRIMLDRQAF